MSTVTVRILRYLLLGIVGAAIGCAGNKAPPPPLVAPGAGIELAHFSGSALSGPTTQPVQAIGADQAWLVDVSIYAMERMPRAAMRSVGTQARLIVATQGGEPVLPSTELAAASRCGFGAEAEAFVSALDSGALGRTTKIGAQRGAMLPGLALAARTTDPGAQDDSSGPWRGVVVSRPAAPSGDLELALVMQDLVAPAPADVDAAEVAQRPAPILQRELALMDRSPPLSTDGATAAFVVPLRMAGGAAEAVAAIVRVRPSPSAQDADEVYAESMREVAQSIERERAQAHVVPRGLDDAQSYRAALDALAYPANRRRSMAYLADQTGAPICLDVALVADDAALEELSSHIREATAAPQATGDRAALGWALDRAALALLAARSGAERAPPELAAVLVAHAGEAGRHAGSMEEVQGSAATRQDLEARLVAENYVFLEDNSPASRVRAYDWLLARGRAPEGYDPLASNRERRDALERALASPAVPAAATAANGGQP
jgi:hypothetical protein